MDDALNFDFPGLYLLIDSDKKKIYVGESSNVKERANNHPKIEFDKMILLWDGRHNKTSHFGNETFRKTANCVLVYAFEQPAIPVDTHVHRISNRLGLVSTKMPEETEMELRKTIPKKFWLDINNTFVMYGQNICKPISPMCDVCKIRNTCNYFKTKNAS